MNTPSFERSTPWFKPNPHQANSVPPFPDADTRNVILPGCARCPGLTRCRERISWGNGPSDADVMVVGEAPAAGVAPRSTERASGDEPRAGDSDADRWQGGNWTGLAYTSRHSGRTIRELFAAIDVDPYYTNAVKCFPADPDDPETNREPTPAERRRCGMHLQRELELVDPAVVVATGRHATDAVLHFEDHTLDGFLDSVLDPIHCPHLGVTLLPILHPSYQNVWLSRLDLPYGQYRESIRATVARATKV